MIKKHGLEGGATPQRRLGNKDLVEVIIQYCSFPW